MLQQLFVYLNAGNDSLCFVSSENKKAQSV